MKSLTLSFPAAGAGRLQVIDELRGLAILLVLTYHICGVTGFPNYTHGDIGVDIFVFLSGTALALSHRPEESGWKFLFRRFARLLPAYWITLTLFWLGGVYILHRPAAPMNVIAHYLCIHEFWGESYFMSFNDSFWFLSLAVLLYGVFTILRRWFDRLDIVIGVGFILSFLAAWITFKWNQPSVFLHLGLRPTLFFVGIPFGLLLKHGQIKIPVTPWLGLGSIFIIYGLFVTGLLVGYTAAGFSVLFGYFAMRIHAGDAGERVLCRRLAWLGTFSYEIYLLHQPLIRDYNDYIWRLFKGAPPSATQTAVGVALALVLTYELAQGLAKLGGWIQRKLLGPSRTVNAETSEIRVNQKLS
ncbi:MAG TPA: acyltransferase [Opitutaceae bacterium]|nr:acyltransferase [Opitutaceae bacterium]